MTTNKQSGIYRIKNTETGVVYVGQTSETFAKRWGRHRRALKACRHGNAHLQRSYNKHGKDAFEYKVLEVIPQGDMSDKEFESYLNKREIILIAEHDARRNGYNFTDGGGGCMGYTQSEEHKAKIGAANTGKKHTAEARAKISAAVRRRVITDETRKKLSAALMGHKRNVGHKHTEEHKSRISAALKGRTITDEHKAKITAAKMGHKHTAETRAKIGLANKGKARGKPWTAARRAAENKRKERGDSYAHKGKPWTAARRAAHEASKESE